MMLALTNAAIYVSIVSVLLLSLRVIRPGILPAQLGIGGKGQLTKFNKRRLQQNRTQHTINDICNKEPDHRLDPRVTVDQEHNLLFKHVHGKQQLAQTDVETYYEYYHRHKRRKRKLLQLVVLAVALMTGRYVILETVSNDLCSYVSQTGDLRSSPSDSISSALFSNTTEAPCLYSQRSNRSQPSTTQAVWHGEQLSLQQSPPSSLVTVSPVLSGHPFCCNTMLLSMIDSLHLQQAQPCLAHRRTQSWPTRDSFRTLASITDIMTTADLLSKDVLQTSSFTKTKDSSNVSAPTTPMQKPVLQHDKAHPHANRTDAAQPTGASEISDPYWQLVPLFEKVTEAKLLETMTCKIHTRDREPATSLSSTCQQKNTQPQAPVRTAGPSSSVETNVECKLFPTPHLDDAASGPQQPTLPPQVTTHVKMDMARQSMCDHFKAPAHMRSIEIDLPPNTNAQALLHTAYNEQVLLKQALQHIVPMLNMVLYTLLPILATTTWLFLSVVATAMSIYAETSRTKQSSKFVQHHLPLQAFAILVSVLCMMSSLTMFVLTQLHCMLTLATAYSFLTHPHWISACLMMICGPKGMQQLLAGLTQAIEHAIQSVVKHPKQPKFAHPKIRNGRYWRRVRNRTRWMHKQFVCKYVKALCWLHQFIQHAKTQHQTP